MLEKQHVGNGKAPGRGGPWQLEVTGWWPSAVSYGSSEVKCRWAQLGLYLRSRDNHSWREGTMLASSSDSLQASSLSGRLWQLSLPLRDPSLSWWISTERPEKCVLVSVLPLTVVFQAVEWGFLTARVEPTVFLVAHLNTRKSSQGKWRLCTPLLPSC